MRLAPASIAALATSLLLAAAAQAALVNGGFEPGGPIGSYAALPGGSTSIPGWVTTDTGVEWFAPSAYGVGAAPDGMYVVDIANYTYSAGGIQQTFATTPGVPVTISFSLGTSQSSGRDGTAEIVVSADGQSQTFTAVNHSAVAIFEPKTFTFVADDASATLSFRCLQNANAHFAYIDGVAQNVPTGVNATTWGVMKRLFR